MGYTSFQAPKGASTKSLLIKEFGKATPTGEGVVDVATANHGREAYVAYKTKKGAIICLVVLIERGKSSAYAGGKYNFTYRDMDEGMHPVYYNCPPKIFMMLSPPESNYTGSALQGSREWRAEVKKRLTKKR